jgi:hypothetical protein
MGADDRTGSGPWAATSPQHLDQTARRLRTAAWGARLELRRDPPDPALRASALDLPARQVQAMLGPDLPDRPPVGTAAQEEYVRTALALAVHVRACRWAKGDLGALSVPGRDGIPHAGEHWMANAKAASAGSKRAPW